MQIEEMKVACNGRAVIDMLELEMKRCRKATNRADPNQIKYFLPIDASTPGRKQSMNDNVPKECNVFIKSETLLYL